VNRTKKDFGYGTIMIPIADQVMDINQLQGILQEAIDATAVPIHAVNTGFSLQGIDLGSRNLK